MQSVYISNFRYWLRTGFLMALLLFASGILFAQAPQGINYQAVARDTSGTPLNLTSVTVELGISTDSAGTVLEWEETHTVTTNRFGLFSLVIGNGTSTGNGSAVSFSNVDWGSGDRFLKVRINPGSGFQDMGSVQLMSVPYALYAETAGNINFNDTSANNELIDTAFVTGDTLFIVEQDTQRIALGNSLNLDNDSTNELIDSIALFGDTLRFFEGDTTHQVLLGNLFNFNDTSANNEIQTLTYGNDSLKLSNGGGSVLVSSFADTSNFNELDTFNFAGIVGDSIKFVFNGDTLHAIPLSAISSTADTNIVAGSIVGQNIELLNDQGGTVAINISSIMNDTNALNELDTFNFAGIVGDSVKFVYNGDTAHAIALSSFNTGSDTSIVSGSIVGSNIELLDNQGGTITVDIASILNDTSALNELDTFDFAGVVGDSVKFVYNGDTVSSIALADLNTAVDTSIVSGSIVGSNIELLNNQGGTITVNISSILNDTNALNELDTFNFAGVVGDSLKFVFNGDTLHSVLLADLNTAIDTNVVSGSVVGSNIELLDDQGGTIIIDISSILNDTSATNEQIDSVYFSNDSVIVVENGVMYGTSIAGLSNTDTLQNFQLIGTDTLRITDGNGQITNLNIDTLASEGEVAIQVALLQNSIDSNKFEIDTLQADLIAHIALDNDTSASNEQIDSVYFSNDSVIVVENGVMYGTSIAGLSNTDTLQNFQLIGTDTLRITDGNGQVTNLNIDTLASEGEVAIQVALLQNSIDSNKFEIDTLQADLIAHIALDNDTSATNELDTFDFAGVIGDSLKFVFNGDTVNSVLLDDLNTAVDTNLVSGSIVGQNIELIDNHGGTVDVDISTILNDTSATNEIISSVTFDNATRILTVIENGTSFSDTIFSTTFSDTIVSGSIVGTDVVLVDNDGSQILIDISSLATDGELAAEVATINNQMTVDSLLFDARIDSASNAIQTHVADDNDTSATNELQNLSINGANDSLLISNGTGIDLASLQVADTLPIIQSSTGATFVNTATNGQVEIGINDTARYTFLENRIETKQASVYIGTGAGENDPIPYDDSVSNVAIGYHALQSNNGNAGTVAIGAEALENNGLNGPDNTAIGNQAMKTNFNGADNVAIGKSSLKNAFNPNGNVAVGKNALESMTSGNGNVAIGRSAGSGLTNGGGNVFIGSFAGFTGTGSNLLYIANSGTAFPLIYGDFSSGIMQVNGTFRTQSGGDTLTYPTADGNNGEVLTTDGNGNLTFQPASGVDNDWDTTATAVYNLTKNIGLGTAAPNTDSRQHINIATTDNFPRGLLIDNSYLGTSTKGGIEVNITNSVGPIGTYGIQNNYTNTNANTGFFRGVSNIISTGGTGERIGVYNSFSTNSIAALYGMKTEILAGGSNIGSKFGVYSEIVSQASSSSATGYFSDINNQSSTPSYSVRGVMSNSGTGTNFGVHMAGEDANFLSNKLGIGDATPDSLLDVAGGARVEALNINNSYTFPTTAPGANQVIKNVGGVLVWANDSTGAGTDGDWDTIGNYVFNLTDSIGIGIAAPLARLHLESSDTTGFYSVLNGSTSSESVAGVFENNRTGGSSATNVGLRSISQGVGSGLNIGLEVGAIDGDNNIGINAVAIGDGFGTEAIGLTTVAAGAARNTGVSSEAFTGFPADTAIAFYGDADGGGTNYAAWFENGEVYVGDSMGIGVEIPAQRLDVDGGVLADSLFADSIVIGNYGISGAAGSPGDVLTLNGAGTVASWTAPSTGDGDGIYDGSDTLSGNTVVTQLANTLDFTTTATDGFSVDGTTFSVDGANNRVGIGTASPNNELDVVGTISSNVLFNSSHQHASFKATLGDKVLISGNSAGGAGNTAAGAIIDEGIVITNLINRDNRVAFQNGTGGFGSNRGVAVGQSSAGEALFYQYENLAMRFKTNNTDRLTILGGGNVGIGNTAPDSLLDVAGGARVQSLNINSAYTLPTVAPTTGQVITYNGTDVVWSAVSGDGDGIYDGSGSLSGNTVVTQGASTLDFTTTATDGFNVDGATFSVDGANNRVGIGTAGPTSPLHVVGTSAAGQLTIASTNYTDGGQIRMVDQISEVGTTDDDLLISADGGVYIRLDDNNDNISGADPGFAIFGQNSNNSLFFVEETSGRVGIGTNAPAYSLDVDGAIRTGTNGTDGQFRIYSEQGGTDHEVVFRPASAMTQTTTYTLPPNDGDASDVLTTDGTGSLSWAAPSGTTPSLDLVLAAGDDGAGENIVNIDSLGIGTATPESELHVDGYITIEGASKSRIRNFEAGGREILQMRADSSLSTGAGINLYGSGDTFFPDQIRLYTTNTTTPDVTVNSLGHVGIGTDLPDFRLTVTQGIDSVTASISNTTSGSFVNSSALKVNNGGSGTGSKFGAVVTSTGTGGTENAGLIGSANGASDINFGVVGLAEGGSATSNVGVLGRAIATSASDTAIGVLGEAKSTSGVNIALAASASGSAVNYAALFDAGDVVVADNVGIGVLAPAAKLDVDGAIKLDTVAVGLATAGMIQWNATTSDFEGFDGATWKSLTSSTAATCPAGYTSVNARYCISTTPETATDWFSAADDCGTDEAKLPTWSEWYIGIQAAGVTSGGSQWEWVDDLSQNNAMKVGGGGGGSPLQTRAAEDPTSGVNYRCVYYKN